MPSAPVVRLRAGVAGRSTSALASGPKRRDRSRRGGTCRMGAGTAVGFPVRIGVTQSKESTVAASSGAKLTAARRPPCIPTRPRASPGRLLAKDGRTRRACCLDCSVSPFGPWAASSPPGPRLAESLRRSRLDGTAGGPECSAVLGCRRMFFERRFTRAPSHPTATAESETVALVERPIAASATSDIPSSSAPSVRPSAAPRARSAHLSRAEQASG